MTKWSSTLLRALPTLLCVACAEPDAYTCDPTTTNCFTYSQTQSAGNTTASTAGSTTASGNVQSSTTTGGVIVGGGATTAGDTSLTTGGFTTGGTTTTTTGGGVTTTSGGTTGSTTTTTTTGGGGTTTTTTTGGGATTTTGGGTTTTTTTGGTTITSRFVVDNFSNASAFMSNLNTESPANLIGEGNVTTYTLNTSTNQMELDCNNTICYWWCLLAAQGSCLNITGFTHFEITLQGPAGADAVLQLQQNDSTCQSTMFTAAQNAAPFSSFMAFDNSVHTVYIPLSSFAGIQQQYTRAIAIVNLVQNKPVFINSINLVTIQ